jgi:predicted signal transduction protein with EAL and GGDEF domain
VRKPSAKRERRTNHLTRKFVAEMSQKAKESAEFVSEMTGLPNRRAFDERTTSPFVAMSDVDNLKPINDRFGYSVGDMLIRRFAEVLTSVGLDPYHHLGGTFLCKGESYQELNLKLSQARQILRQQPFSVSDVDGRVIAIESAEFSFGIGTTVEEAEVSLGQQKKLRVSESG